MTTNGRLPLARSRDCALSARVNVAPGSFLGREVAGLSGPVWSMMAWYLLITGLILAGTLYTSVSTNDVGTSGLRVFGLVYCLGCLAVLARLRSRTPGWLLFILVDVNIAVACLISASWNTVFAAAVPLATLVIAALYAATWFRHADMLAHLGWLTVLSAIAVFLASDSANLRVLWFAIVFLCWGLGLFVNALVRDLNQQVMTDPLTSLLNRTGLDLVVDHLGGDRPHLMPRSVAFLDLKDFKEFNDRDGHHAGDEVLRQVGSALQAQLRASDIPARTGGDEFVIVLPSTSLEHARVVLGRIIKSLPVGCSFGLVDWPAGTTFDDAVRAADREMYTDKRRNSL
ncbi:GGDEF domain-containing protein [Demequina aurantiaca]|uniref:GGDEF domain-containing protein n=1 Tax=Demequina aurantiaca TaxID=676200 RepID=UPI003D32C4D7